MWSAGKNSPESTCTPNLKNVASSDTEILRGSQISFFPRSLAPEPIRPKINRLRGTVEEYYGSEFQVIPIKRFLSRALTYIHTNIQTYIQTYIQSQNSIHAECTTCSAWITRTCTLWRCKSTPTRTTKCSWCSSRHARYFSFIVIRQHCMHCIEKLNL